VQLALCISIVDVSFALSRPILSCACVVLFCLGQLLNLRVYQLLGSDGVYYGKQLGKSVPWVTAWPYSQMRNPQYWGCLLCLVGATLVLPVKITGFWALNYLALVWLESRPGGAPLAKGRKSG